ncbi:aldehyde dehydrogenase, partial [Oleiphilus sp. HI0081]
VDDKPGFKRFIKKCPVGTVAVLAPWNYPLHTPINSIIPALLAGNSVILKHSAQTPLCGERIVEAFADAGLPQGVLQCLHMSHDTAKTMLEQPSIKAVTFTGSVEAGKDIEKACAGRFINLTLELGGKDPAYIRSDADLEYAVESTVDGAFFNSGQSCCGLERIYVHQSIYSAYVERFVELTREYVLGCSNDQATTLGPVVNASAAARIRKQIQGAIDSGAKANIDVTNFPLDQNGTAYLAPQVLTNVDHSMSVMRDETFGPVVGIMAVSSDEEAVKLMNDSDLGLSAAIYSNDLEAATALGEKIE